MTFYFVFDNNGCSFIVSWGFFNALAQTYLKAPLRQRLVHKDHDKMWQKDQTWTTCGFPLSIESIGPGSNIHNSLVDRYLNISAPWKIDNFIPSARHRYHEKPWGNLEQCNTSLIWREQSLKSPAQCDLWKRGYRGCTQSLKSLGAMRFVKTWLPWLYTKPKIPRRNAFCVNGATMAVHEA
jgi:hypothetical protein